MSIENLRQSLQEAESAVKSRREKIRELKEQIRLERSRQSKLKSPRKQVMKVIYYISDLTKIAKEAGDHTASAGMQKMWQEILGLLAPVVEELERDYAFKVVEEKPKSREVARSARGRK